MSTTTTTWPPPLGLPIVGSDVDTSDESTRPSPRLSTRGRVLSVVAVAALLGGGGFGVAGLLVAGDVNDDVVLDAGPLLAPVPSTVAPVATPADARAETAAAPVDERRDSGRNEQPAGPNPAAAPRSPLADLLGPSYSAVPDEIEPRPRPIVVDVEGLDVDQFPIRPVGLEPDGQLEIPDETEIGWYFYGATAGRPGTTVLAAHVSWNRTVGPFGALGRVEPGDRITVTLDDGLTRDYEVYERALYGKLELPRERIWRNTGPETLVLITCGGDFNPEIRRYRQNIVVYAAPVG